MTPYSLLSPLLYLTLYLDHFVVCYLILFLKKLSVLSLIGVSSLVVHQDSLDPGVEGTGGNRTIPNMLLSHLWLLHQLADLSDFIFSDFILVVLLQVHDKVRVRDHLLAGDPVCLSVHKDCEGLQDYFDDDGRIVVGLELRDVSFLDAVKLLQGGAK